MVRSKQIILKTTKFNTSFEPIIGFYCVLNDLCNFTICDIQNIRKNVSTWRHMSCAVSAPQPHTTIPRHPNNEVCLGTDNHFDTREFQTEFLKSSVRMIISQNLRTLQVQNSLTLDRHTDIWVFL